MNSAELVQFYSEQINKIRQYPQKFIPLLEDRLQRFGENNQYSHYQFGNILFQTVDGKSSVKNAIQYLQNLKERKPLWLCQKLCQAAYQVGNQMYNDRCSQVDLNIYKQRIKLAVEKQTDVSDTIQAIVEYGFRKDIDLLASILIDDGNPQKLRRQILLSQKSRSIGISVHQHTQFDFFVLFLVSDHQEPIGCQCLLI